jgi:hypothetical protein
MRISMQSSLHAWLSMIEHCQDLLMEHQRMRRCLIDEVEKGSSRFCEFVVILKFTIFAVVISSS